MARSQYATVTTKPSARAAISAASFMLTLALVASASLSCRRQGFQRARYVSLRGSNAQACRVRRTSAANLAIMLKLVCSITPRPTLVEQPTTPMMQDAVARPRRTSATRQWGRESKEGYVESIDVSNRSPSPLLCGTASVVASADATRTVVSELRSWFSDPHEIERRGHLPPRQHPERKRRRDTSGATLLSRPLLSSVAALHRSGSLKRARTSHLPPRSRAAACTRQLNASTRQRAAATCVDYACGLPDELLRSAMSFLDAPGLIRARSVCRAWCRLVSAHDAAWDMAIARMRRPGGITWYSVTTAFQPAVAQTSAPRRVGYIVPRMYPPPMEYSGRKDVPSLARPLCSMDRYKRLYMAYRDRRRWKELYRGWEWLQQRVFRKPPLDEEVFRAAAQRAVSKLVARSWMGLYDCVKAELYLRCQAIREECAGLARRVTATTGAADSDVDGRNGTPRLSGLATTTKVAGGSTTDGRGRASRALVSKVCRMWKGYWKWVRWVSALFDELNGRVEMERERNRERNFHTPFVHELAQLAFRGEVMLKAPMQDGVLRAVDELVGCCLSGVANGGEYFQRLESLSEMCATLKAVPDDHLDDHTPHTEVLFVRHFVVPVTAACEQAFRGHTRWVQQPTQLVGFRRVRVVEVSKGPAGL